MKTFKEFSKINENHNFTNEANSGLKGVKEYRDGLTPEIIQKDFPWLMQAKLENAVIGKNSDGLIVWYKGTWISGTWEKGVWKNGTWENGTWQYGIWKDGKWKIQGKTGTTAPIN